MKKTYLFTACTVLFTAVPLPAQVKVTNAFDDLKRQGVVNESYSDMRQAASPEKMQIFLSERPEAGYFCFTEDRMHDIRLPDALPERWVDRPAGTRTLFEGTAAPGEFYTWQIGVFAPYHPLDSLSVDFTDWTNEDGERIDAAFMRCFNLEGTGTDGLPFHKTLNVPKGNVQPLWIGAEIPGQAQGVYTGTVTVHTKNGMSVPIRVRINVTGDPIADHGDNEGWRKTRLRWLDSSVGQSERPTAPYTPVRLEERTLSWLGGTLELAPTGLPRRIVTRYDAANRLAPEIENPVLADEMTFVVETGKGRERLQAGSIRIIKQSEAEVSWETTGQGETVQVVCRGSLGFDGLADYRLEVKAEKETDIRDIRLEVPYSPYASRYMMGLGRAGGFRPDSTIRWQWDTNRHQDKIWMGNVNAGMNICLTDERYVRPLVNIYYELGKLRLPVSWGNGGKGGITVGRAENERVLLTAYSGPRKLKKGETLHYCFRLLVTPVKPLNLKSQATERFYHSNSDVSATYIPAAIRAGANMINVHHKKDIYPFINYPYSDESADSLKRFIAEAHARNLKVRLYYTTRELTVKIPELWALRSLGGEIIHDGPGKDTQTLIHPDGPNEWLNRNLGDHFIPAWYNAFKEGPYAGDMDLSVITTPDSRWNNYYLEGLDWMIRNLGIDGIYIDDSALDRRTLQRARRILDADGQRRPVDLHSWNHLNQWAGFANSVHLYLELLPSVDRLWIGEGFDDRHTPDFWLVEMSGIPFGLMSEMLDARNLFRGMIFGMLPRLPWSGNPVPLWKVWDRFGMQQAAMRGYWDDRCPISSDNENVPVTVYINGDRALGVLANWTDRPQTVRLTFREDKLGFRPAVFSVPEIEGLQKENANWQPLRSFSVPAGGGIVFMLSR